MRFPGGRAKALTLSYDDGVRQDHRLMEMLNRHGIKATFNLNSGLFLQQREEETPLSKHRMTMAQAAALFRNSGHEIASHGKSHAALEQLPYSDVVNEIMEDRRVLETVFGGIVRGFAYPFGSYDERVIDSLKACGIAYARTVEASEGFELPVDWLRLKPTCHHNHPALMELADAFLRGDDRWGPKMFYLWGRSYEFDGDNNWQVMEEFCKYAGANKNIWYATNICIHDYVEAYRQLRCSVDGRIVYNPTDITVCADMDGCIVEFPAATFVQL